MSQTDDFLINVKQSGKCEISGVLRLPSPLSYNVHFKPIFKEIEDNNESLYKIDLSGLNYLNSSGITALARLIIHARKEGQTVELVVNGKIPWQEKSLGHLTRLWKGVQVKYS